MCDQETHVDEYCRICLFVELERASLFRTINKHETLKDRNESIHLGKNRRASRAAHGIAFSSSLGIRWLGCANNSVLGLAEQSTARPYATSCSLHKLLAAACVEVVPCIEFECGL